MEDDALWHDDGGPPVGGQVLGDVVHEQDFAALRLVNAATKPWSASSWVVTSVRASTTVGLIRQPSFTLSSREYRNKALSGDSLPATIPSKNVADGSSERIFVVYGHDETAREQLEVVLHRLALDPFVLGITSGSGLTIIEALEKEILSPNRGKRFGIVLLTPDDMGYKKEDGPEEAEPRARQNVGTDGVGLRADSLASRFPARGSRPSATAERLPAARERAWARLTSG